MRIRNIDIRENRPPARISAPAAALVLALVMAACGGGETTGDTGAGQTAVEETPSGGGEAAVTVTEADAEEQPETLGEYLGYDFDDPDAQAARDADNRRRTEEIVARCMAEEGFEYIPAVRPFSPSAYAALDEEEYAREAGFGITTWYGREIEPAPEDDWVDPNIAIVEAMSDSERKAYRAAHFGEVTERVDADPESGAAIEEAWGGGCTGQAYREVYGGQDEMWEQIAPMLEEMYQRALADPRYQAANDGWAACMSDRGYRYDSIDQMYGEIYDDFGGRFEEIVGSEGGWVNPFEGWSEERVDAFLAENSQEEIDDFYEQAQSEARAAVDQDALAALQQEERDLAVADYECAQDIRGVVEEIQQEYERRFISENRDLLEQLRG